MCTVLAQAELTYIAFDFGTLGEAARQSVWAVPAQGGLRLGQNVGPWETGITAGCVAHRPMRPAFSGLLHGRSRNKQLSMGPVRTNSNSANPSLCPCLKERSRDGLEKFSWDLPVTFNHKFSLIRNIKLKGFFLLNIPIWQA